MCCVWRKWSSWTTIFCVHPSYGSLFLLKILRQIRVLFSIWLFFPLENPQNVFVFDLNFEYTLYYVHQRRIYFDSLQNGTYSHCQKKNPVVNTVVLQCPNWILCSFNKNNTQKSIKLYFSIPKTMCIKCGLMCGKMRTCVCVSRRFKLVWKALGNSVWSKNQFRTTWRPYAHWIWCFFSPSHLPLSFFLRRICR